MVLFTDYSVFPRGTCVFDKLASFHTCPLFHYRDGSNLVEFRMLRLECQSASSPFIQRAGRVLIFLEHISAKHFVMPLSTQEVINIPVIDILNADIQTGEQLVNAVVQWGFVFIKAHGSGFTSDIINNMFQIVSLRHLASLLDMRKILSINLYHQSGDFFQSALEDKKSHSITENVRLDRPYFSSFPPPPFSHQQLKE